MSRVKWVPPRPGGGATRQPPKVVFEGVPPNTALARELLNRYQGQIDRFYIKANQHTELTPGGQDGYRKVQQVEEDGLEMQYSANNGQEIIRAKLPAHVLGQVEKPLKGKPWDWVLIECHTEFADSNTVYANYRALRTIPASTEAGLLRGGLVYANDVSGRHEDGLVPPALQYPPDRTVVEPRVAVAGSTFVASLLVDMRRYNYSENSIVAVRLDGHLTTAIGSQDVLSGYVHSSNPTDEDPDPSGVNDYLVINGPTVYIGTAHWHWDSPSSGSWVTSPADLLEEGSYSEQAAEPGVGGGAKVGSAGVDEAPISDGVIDFNVVPVTATPLAGLPAAGSAFWRENNASITTDPVSGLIEERKVRNATVIGNNSGANVGLPGNTEFYYDVYDRVDTYIWRVEEVYTSESVPLPETLPVDVRITGGFGDPAPDDSVVVTMEDVAEHTRFGVENDGGDGITFLSTFRIGETEISGPPPDPLFPELGVVTIDPWRYAASFAPNSVA